MMKVKVPGTFRRWGHGMGRMGMGRMGGHHGHGGHGRRLCGRGRRHRACSPEQEFQEEKVDQKEKVVNLSDFCQEVPQETPELPTYISEPVLPIVEEPEAEPVADSVAETPPVEEKVEEKKVEAAPEEKAVQEEPKEEPKAEQPQQEEGTWHQALGNFFGLVKPEKPNEVAIEAKEESKAVEQPAEVEQPAQQVVMAIPVAMPIQPPAEKPAEKEDVVIKDIEYPAEFEQLKQMGFENEWQVNLVLKKNKGDVQATALALLDM